MLRGKFIVLIEYVIYKEEIYKISYLSVYLRKLEIKNKILIIRAKVNKIENKISEAKSWFLKMINKIDKPLPGQIRKSEKGH